MKKNLLKPFLVTLLVIFCSVSVNAQRVENGKLLSWDGASGSIKIPDGVTEIAENCFYTQDEGGEDSWGGGEAISNTQITSVDFNQVTTIGKNAFRGCTGITSLVAIHVKTINKEAFEGCTSIKTLSLACLARQAIPSGGSCPTCSAAWPPRPRRRCSGQCLPCSRACPRPARWRS